MTQTNVRCIYPLPLTAGGGTLSQLGDIVSLYSAKSYLVHISGTTLLDWSFSVEQFLSGICRLQWLPQKASLENFRHLGLEALQLLPSRAWNHGRQRTVQGTFVFLKCWWDLQIANHVNCNLIYLQLFWAHDVIKEVNRICKKLSLPPLIQTLLASSNARICWMF